MNFGMILKVRDRKKTIQNTMRCKQQHFKINPDMTEITELLKIESLSLSFFLLGGTRV